MEPTPIYGHDDDAPAPQDGQAIVNIRPSDKAHEVAAYVANIYDHMAIRYADPSIAAFLTELALKYIPA